LPRTFKITQIDRIIDANTNRAKEGLRVCEEIARFILNSYKLTSELKKVRHKIDSLIKGLSLAIADLVKSRESRLDIGKNIYINELKRGNLTDVFFANMQRVKESIRVLEEFSKLKSANSAVAFKKIRYEIYEIEKKITQKISSLPDNR
jgi:thiamine-phosphate pyrophosphorylase